jgi:hypothetical protein
VSAFSRLTRTPATESEPSIVSPSAWSHGSRGRRGFSRDRRMSPETTGGSMLARNPIKAPPDRVNRRCCRTAGRSSRRTAP